LNKLGAITAAVAVWLGAGGAQAAELKVLSAGALEPALRAAVKGFHDAAGDTVSIEFATAAVIRERAKAPLSVELVAGPDPLIAELTQAGRVVSKPADLGRVGVGVAVRTDAAIPDISSPQALKAALLGAKTVVYNRASSGVSVEVMVQKLGIADALAARTERFPDAYGVMTRLIAGTKDEIGLGATTAISLYTDKGLRLVGPVPAELQSYTYYGVSETPTATPLARAFVAYLSSPAARATMTAAGVGPR
jgi:molybdate transport system substrate-binding protein